MAQESLRRLFITVFAVSLGGCGGGGSDGSSSTNPGLPPQTSVTPEDTGDGWAVSSASAEGIDQATLLAAMQSIRDGDYPGVDSLLVVRHGRLVAEGYFNGFGRDAIHDLRSTGKSFTSALAGIAIDQGLIGIDDPISQHLPDFENHANMDGRKRAITVRNLLNMSSGLECNDWDPSSRGNEERMYGSRDWVKFILDLHMVNEPGVVASYCTGGVIVLGDILSLRSGMTLDNYAATYLFGPLGIQQSRWRLSPDGRATGGGGLWLRPRDTAKFGQLYLDGGTWKGVRVVPANWVEQSRVRSYTFGRDGYGLLWWKRTFSYDGATVDSFFTSGNGGNFIFVVPALDLVVTFTGSNYNSPRGDQPFAILENRVLSTVH